MTNHKCVPTWKNIYEKWPETHYKAVIFHEFSHMSPNSGREGRDPGFIGFEGFPNHPCTLFSPERGRRDSPFWKLWQSKLKERRKRKNTATFSGHFQPPFSPINIIEYNVSILWSRSLFVYLLSIGDGLDLMLTFLELCNNLNILLILNTLICIPPFLFKISSDI